jgi:biopolymer transport protein ExbD
MGVQFEPEEQAEVSMSPLIDCVFLLLIFFLVSTMTKKENMDIDIALPVSTAAEAEIPKTGVVVVGIDKEGKLYYKGEETTVNMLHLELRDISLANTKTPIRLDSDKETPLHRVVEVMDLCQFNNLVNVGIRTYDEHYNKK